MDIIIILIGIAVGASFVIIRSLNLNLSSEIGIYGSNLVNHITGTIASILIVLVAIQSMNNIKINLLNIPWYAYLGGIIGALFVIISNYTFSKTSVISSTILILSGQFLSSILIDIMIFNREISLKNIMGALVIIFSVFLYNCDNGRKNDNNNI